MTDPNSTEAALVLLVDDEPAVADMVRAHLDASWYRLAHVPSVATAERWLEGGEQPVAVLVDLRIPPYDGPEAIRMVVSLVPSSVPVLALTGLTGSGLRTAIAEAGAEAVVAKDGLGELTETIRFAVARHKRAHQNDPRRRSMERLARLIAGMVARLERVDGRLLEIERHLRSGLIRRLFMGDLTESEAKRLRAALLALLSAMAVAVASWLGIDP